MTDHPRRITRALLSVSDKTGLVDFARALAGHGVELVSTGGTAKALDDAGLEGDRRRRAHRLSRNDGWPRQDAASESAWRPAGDPRQQGARRRDGRRTASQPIDLLVVNLYPFEATVAKGADFDDCIENIDIGGPAMIRAAAKNHADVAVVVEPPTTPRARRALAQHGGATTLELRQKLAAKAYARTAAYDAAISNWFAETLQRRRAGLPRLRRQADRSAALRREPAPERRRSTARRASASASPRARQLQGKELSYNNINDTDAAYECVAEFDPKRTPACVIVKHANPCGVAEGASLLEAYRKALACDPVSAFGGIVALNRTLDAEAARAITEIFTEVIIAPDATDEAIAIVGGEEEPAAAAGRRPARSARRRADGEVGRRRPAGAVARQRRGRRHGS